MSRTGAVHLLKDRDTGVRRTVHRCLLFYVSAMHARLFLWGPALRLAAIPVESGGRRPSPQEQRNSDESSCPHRFCVWLCYSCMYDLLARLVVKASASAAEDPGFESRLRRDFSGSSHTSDLKFDTPVATLPGAWRCRVSAGLVLVGPVSVYCDWVR